MCMYQESALNFRELNYTHTHTLATKLILLINETKTPTNFLRDKFPGPEIKNLERGCGLATGTEPGFG